MTRMNTKLTAVVETYLAALRRVNSLGGAIGACSRYGPLVNLLNAVGAMLKFDEVQLFTDITRRIAAIILVASGQRSSAQSAETGSKK